MTKLMNSLGFSDYKTRNSKGDERGYEMNFQKVCEILFRQNFLTLEIIQKKVSEVSDCQYNEDKIREILSDTSLTTDTFENTPKDFSDNLTDKTLFRGVKKDNPEDYSQKW